MLHGFAELVDPIGRKYLHTRFKSYRDDKEFIGNFSNGEAHRYAIINLNMQDEKYRYFQKGKLVKFADESNSKGLAEHKYNLKSFVECALLRLSMKKL